MTVLADLVSITTRPDTGAPILKVRSHGYKLLGGAILYDLVDRGRLGRTGEGNKSRVVLLDPAPVPEPSLEYGLARVRRHREQWPRNAVLRLGGGIKLRDGIYGGLVTEGVLGPKETTGRFTAPRHRVLDPGHRDELLRRLQAALLGGQPSDRTTRRLAALLAIADQDSGPLLDIVLDGPGDSAPPSGAARQELRARATERSREMIRSDWIALSVLRAVKLPQELAKAGSMMGLADSFIPR